MSLSYNGLEFETELLAHWAAFFDLAGWEWDRGISAVGNWKPDFRVSFPCGHSECSGSHTILVSVLPINAIENVKGHPAIEQGWGVENSLGQWLADAGALFGNTPNATEWVMAHGAGGGVENVYNWVDNANVLWIQARSLVLKS
ncbi:hypothetical protein C0J26_14405 [Pseudomonas baetica]|uniref:hypothetical protein n=1 Tax=Pseudomonas baetica TaxID=674054 RepID=UPI000C2BA9A8|nr:hypothetical protein [Pseudomonas baetica]PTC19553.1 hypothetical protein C0J26_14405 [Pseudomonas baetica]